MHPLLRYTLDLFASPVPPPAPKRAPKRIITPPLPVTTPVPLSYTHPRASRQVRLGDAVVAYEFTRARRRSIGFTVGMEGLAARAPTWVVLSEVERALQERADWILRKLFEARQRQALQASRVTHWRDGAAIPWLGQTLTLRLEAQPSSVGSARRRSKLEPARFDTGDASSGPVLHLALGQDATEAQVSQVVKAWFLHQAKTVFTQRLDHFAPQLGVQWSSLALSNANTRWGSARSNGAIRLNWRLLHFPMAVLDYVVVHELCHLRVMDHSARFWALVRSIEPDYLQLRRQLKDDAVPRW